MEETAMTDGCNRRLRELLRQRKAVLLPGAANALAARVIEDIGFQAIYVTGAGVTNMYMGLPDLSFIGLHEIAEHTARIRDAVELPIIVDADTGFGNPVNTYRTVQILERVESETNRAAGLKRALAKLDDRSRRIIEARWLAEDDPATLQDLADEYGVSAERIRQIEGKAIKSMRGQMAGL